MQVKKISKAEGQKLMGGSLPDIDSDYNSAGRPKVKAYMEERFGLTQVASVGSVTTMKLKGALKDLDRQLDNNVTLANLITSIIDNKDKSMLDLFKRSAKEPKLKEYIQKNSDIFHMMPSLLNQPKTKSIHPCAVIIAPDQFKGKQWVPVRTQKGLMVTEWDGYEMDDAGFLKVDALGLAQLDKFYDILQLIKQNGKEVPDIYNLPEDKEVYRYFSNGWNGDIFQMKTDTLSAYTRYLKPQRIEDLIAIVALYRPGPMENHYHEIYVKCKNEGRTPKYLWGTEEITKDTYGLLVYQEQVMKVCEVVGGLTQMEADDVRRSMGKQKLKELMKWEGKISEGFYAKGANEAQFKEVWDAMIEFTKYSFNKSHSAVYAKTGYICQWLKVNFPLEYWTVAIKYADEAQQLKYLAEIFAAKSITVESCDINRSGATSTSDLSTNTIYWGIESIKGIGETTAQQVIDIRQSKGDYISLDDFIVKNTFKGSKVKKTTIEALISSGAFDSVHSISEDKTKRKLLIDFYRESRKVKISNPARDIYLNGELYYNHWWLLQQKKLTGLAFIDYEGVVESLGIETPFCNNGEFNTRQIKGIKRAFGGYVVEVITRNSRNGKFAVITFESNYKLSRVVLWSDQYKEFKEAVDASKKSLIIFDGMYKYEGKYTKGNQFTIQEDSNFHVLN